MDPFRTVLSSIQDISSPIQGGSLLGFRADLVEFLGRQPEFTNVELSPADQTTQLSVTISLTTEAESIQQVSFALAEAWVALAYHSIQATSTTWYQEAMEFRFVTLPASGTYFAAGTLVVGGPRYREIASQYRSRTGEFLPKAPLQK